MICVVVRKQWDRQNNLSVCSFHLPTMRSVLKEDDVDTHSITHTQTHTQAWKDFKAGNNFYTLFLLHIFLLCFGVVLCQDCGPTAPEFG